jgi:hypothetical protein
VLADLVTSDRRVKMDAGSQQLIKCVFVPCEVVARVSRASNPSLARVLRFDVARVDAVRTLSRLKSCFLMTKVGSSVCLSVW